MALFDNLTPEQQQAVMRNVAKRAGAHRNTNNVATKLRGNDQATAQAMQYIGLDVPASLRENEGDPVFDVYQILDSLADDTAGDGAKSAGGAGTDKAAGSGMAARGNKTPASKPENIEQIAEDQTVGNASGADAGGSNALSMIGAVGGGIAAIYAIKKAYDAVRAGNATPEQEAAVRQAVNAGVDVTNLDQVEPGRALVPASNNLPAVVEGAQGGDAGQAMITDQSQTQALPRQQDVPLLTDQRAIAMPDQTSGAAIALPDQAQGAAGGMNLQELLNSRAQQFQIPNVDIGMQGVDDMPEAYGAPLLRALQQGAGARTKVRVKP